MSDRDYQDESDHATLQRATDISSSRSRMAGVKRHQTKQEKKLALMRKSIGGRGFSGKR